MLPQFYHSLSRATDDLQCRGYCYSFRAIGGRLWCNETGKEYRPGEVQVMSRYLFAEDGTPGDDSMVVAIRGVDGQKGLLVVAGGIDAKNETAAFLSDVEFKEDVP